MRHRIAHKECPIFGRSGAGALLLAALFLWSCGTAPTGAARIQPPAEISREDGTVESPGESSGEGEFPDAPDLVLIPEDAGEIPGESSGEDEFPDEPDSVLTPEDPAESPWQGELEEPLFDFPEAAVEPLPPPERPLAALPEPLAPVFPEPVPEPPALEPEPEPAGPPEPVGPSEPAEIGAVPEAEAPSPAGEPAPAPVPPASPPAASPPPFIRPAEKYEPPPVREPAPRPLIPDPPARGPPVEIPEPGIVYSRVVRATVGQLVEIPFRGTGWVYLGELASRPGIVYGSRRLDPEGQSFIFRTEAAGTYGLKFYKQDFVRDYILNDYVQVIVGEPPEAAAMGWFNPSIDRGRVIAEPRWPSALEEAEAPDRNAPLRIYAAPGGSGGAQGVAVTPGEAAAPGGTGGAQGAAVMPSEVAAASSGAGEVQSETTAPGEAAVPSGAGEAQGTAAPSGAGSAQSETTAPGEAAVTPGGAGEAQGAAVTPGGVAVPGGAGEAQGTAVTQAPGDGMIPVRPATAVQTPGPAEGLGDLRPGDYPERARQEFEAGRVASAIAILDQFRERYPSGSDEAWWLYGQLYEAGGPSRDVRSALDYYRRLIREYPQSPRYNEARRRIAYLERYYINIR